ncbi:MULTISPECIES: cytochrome c biogenesis CcdA family protein [Salimicrobium]|uniref:Cytochrome C biogenesis protein CcdA n=2 Tax=Salimicrobium TaxID=351195 RepID=A0ABX4HNP1_9BACI|nr:MULTISPECIES: cytochrome c biogenesis protein CcdA [Salimicrobium]PBB04822.1 cytochrome C biogenesis protein CcdA [Salimicrobium humidisoli]SIS66225.1 cytochrome c-type biogenesis protein [Salimicrobium salexigens]
MADVNIVLAFGAGFLSFISPCCLPLYPAFLSYITGMSVDDLKGKRTFFQKQPMLHTLFFLIGFSIIFIAIGFSTSWIGSWFLRYDDLLRQLGAIFIALLGLVVIGFFKPKLFFRQRQVTLKNRPPGYIGSSAVGMAFAAGWTPCTGPILAAVIALGVSSPDEAVLYMVSYVLGFSIPFFVMASFIGKMEWLKKYNHRIVTFGGYMMILMGVFLFFGWMSDLTSFLTYRFFNGWTGF